MLSLTASSERSTKTKQSLFPLLQEDEDAFFVGDHDIEQAVAIHVRDGELRADAGIVVNHVRHKADHAILAALRLEPVQVRRIAGAGIALGTMRPPAPAGHQV